LLGLQVRNPRGHGSLSLEREECCQVELRRLDTSFREVLLDVVCF